MKNSKITLKNDTDVEILFILEPWAEEFWIPPRAKIDIVSFGEIVDPIEIEYRRKCIIIYGWTNGITKVMCGHEEINPEFRKNLAPDIYT